jgi:hypothetical protein
VDGPNVIPLGPEDFHDPKYDNMMLSEDLTEYVRSRADAETRAYMTAPLHSSYGLYSLRVYPSRLTEDCYKSKRPALYTALVAFVFLFTCAIHFLLEFFVERRQRIVQDHAVSSGMIVDSLFPKHVQERLYSSNENSSVEEKSKKADFKTSIIPKSIVTKERVTRKGNVARKQIADFFPACSIMFADLSYFTRWSSGRTPTEVFTLLESL